MTVREAIASVDNRKPNAFDITEKLAWLNALDGKIQQEIMDTHDNPGGILFVPYGLDDEDVQLLAPEPWDRMYISYLESQMDYANAEYGRYNNSAAMFQAEYDGFANWYNRTHMPKGTRIRYF